MSALITAIVSATLMGACGRSAHYVPPAALHYVERRPPLPPPKLAGPGGPDTDRVKTRQRPPRRRPAAGAGREGQAPSTRPAGKTTQPPKPNSGADKAPGGRRQRRVWVPEPLPGGFLTMPGRR